MSGQGEDSPLTPRVSPPAPSREALVALRDRLAKATGPDQEIDYEIAMLIDGYSDASSGGYKTSGILWRGDRGYSCPSYTASLDAAVTLVPEGWAWFVEWIGSPFTEGQARLWIPSQRTQHLKVEQVIAEAKTPPLALCLARVEYEIAKAREPASRGEAEGT